MLSLSKEEKESVWDLYEKDKSIEFSHWIYDGYRYTPSLEEAFDLNNPKCIKHTWNEDHLNHKEFLEKEKIDIQKAVYHFEEHHLNVNDTPYWKNCVDSIESALKK